MLSVRQYYLLYNGMPRSTWTDRSNPSGLTGPAWIRRYGVGGWVAASTCCRYGIHCRKLQCTWMQ